MSLLLNDVTTFFVAYWVLFVCFIRGFACKVKLAKIEGF